MQDSILDIRAGRRSMSESVHVVVHIVVQIPSVASGNRMRSVVTLSKRSELHYSIHVFHLRSNETGP